MTSLRAQSDLRSADDVRNIQDAVPHFLDIFLEAVEIGGHPNFTTASPGIHHGLQRGPGPKIQVV
ncbi:Hypothetical protein FKW44_010273 [Caligus rogercresseyi]|uniref:Uncharacterized protein n=1 Tax=Caligus rogercresseyi TaxID=217165 RepID=A0A7T8HGC7_CALRO|nr:Hypothetical protein FKW44_010273 [Caligus rogercresseyi]